MDSFDNLMKSGASKLVVSFVALASLL